MNLVKSIRKALATYVGTSGYDATDSRGRRKPPPAITMHEDFQADQQGRRTLASSARDLNRNFAVAAWAIRKHLDYVSSFTFQSMTDDRAFNADLEAYVEEIQKRHRFDVTRRHPYRRALRIAEACRIKDGDIFWMKLGNGANRGKIQAIEGDRIRTPTTGEWRTTIKDMENWINGVHVDSRGAALSYAVCNRTNKTGFELKRTVRADNMLVVGFYDRFDQIRGVSPIAAGLNWFRDTYEGFEYALAKAKIGQLFGLAFEREGDLSPFGPVTPTQDLDQDGFNESDFEVNLPKGMFSVDLNPGEQAKMIESKTPSTETVQFLEMMLHIAIKTLDLPYSFLDESKSNFFGSRAGLIQYQKSTKTKIRDLQDFQDEWFRWRIGLAVADGDFKIPRWKEFDWLKWQFVPDGVPWWDPIKEVRGNAMAIAAGFSSPQQVCREVGTNFEENVLRIAEAQKFAEDNGVDLVYADTQAFAPEITTEIEPVEVPAAPGVPVDEETENE